MLGSIGFPEILMILVIALLIFGPKKLPEVGRTIGKGLAEFRKASSDLKRSVNAELALDDDERPATPRRPAVATRPLDEGVRSGPGYGPDAAVTPPAPEIVAAENTAARGSLESAGEPVIDESGAATAAGAPDPDPTPVPAPAEGATEPTSGADSTTTH